MAMKKGKKILAALGAIGALVAAVVGVATKADDIYNKIWAQDNTPQLAIVRTVEYNDEYYKLFWDEVANADYYNVNINGETQTVEDNSYFYVPTTQTTEFKVQAVDSSGEYKASEWSDTVTYQIAENEVSYASVNSFVSTMLPQTYQLKKVVNISVQDDKVYTTAVYERNGELKVYELSTQYDFEIQSLGEVMNEKGGYVRILDKYPIANYDAANSLLKSNSYDGQMEEYRKQGYSFEVVSQQVGKFSDDNSTFRIFATYKLTKDSEIKYINNAMQVGIWETSSNEKINYTAKLENAEDRYLHELSCHELTGDEINFAEDMEQANIPLTLENLEQENNQSNSSSGYIINSKDEELSL